MERPHGYMTAIGHDWLLPLYDPLLRWLMHEDAFKRRLIEQARIAPGQRVLDLGCGTATLTILVKQLHPRAEVVGLDGDSKVLEIARRKTERAGVDLSLEEGLSYDLPYADGAFDRVLSSLMLHHLSHEQKLSTLAEVHRVLKPGGELHVVDFGPPSTRLAALLAHASHPPERLRDNVTGGLPALFCEAGLRECEETGQQRTLVGSLSFFRGLK